GYGNTPNKVAQALRKKGAVLEASYPFTRDIRSWEEWAKPLTSSLLKEAEKWGYVIKHEWVDTDPKSLMRGLQRSPLGISVYAWRMEGNRYIKPIQARDNHFTLLVGYKENEYWLIYDSYPESDGVFFKKLAWDYNFGLAKSYSVEKVELNWWQKLCW
ncbi:MAG: hypothetical protein IH946_08280, partial [Bacteroidetes bacterium]|nr:hypothetical protein [Bacteroidota bacterium]